MIMSTIKQLNNILVYTKLNPKSFSEKIGLARPQAIYDIQKGKTKNFSHAMINKIISVFPEFNKSWLLTGEGEMLQTLKLISDNKMSYKFSTIKERILYVLEFKGIVKDKFIKKIGMTYGNFTGKAKETPLNSNAIGNILIELPDINIEWLITGKGEMLLTKKIEVKHNDINIIRMDILNRILQIKEELGYKTDGEFAGAMGINRSNFSQMKQGNRSIGDNILNKISIHLNISKRWLLTGEGEMLIEKEKTISTENLIKEDLKDRCKYLEESVRLLKQENELLKKIIDLTDRIYFLENSKHKSKKDQIKED